MDRFVNIFPDDEKWVNGLCEKNSFRVFEKDLSLAMARL